MPIDIPSNRELLAKYGVNDTACYTHFGAGWDKLLHKMFTRLIELGWKNEEFKVSQVKEKFGELRVYFSRRTLPPTMKAVVDEAELESRTTCDICGEAGKMTTDLKCIGGWMRTRCEKHPNTRDDRWPVSLRKP